MDQYERDGLSKCLAVCKKALESSDWLKLDRYLTTIAHIVRAKIEQRRYRVMKQLWETEPPDPRAEAVADLVVSWHTYCDREMNELATLDLLELDELRYLVERWLTTAPDDVLRSLANASGAEIWRVAVTHDERTRLVTHRNIRAQAMAVYKARGGDVLRPCRESTASSDVGSL